MLHALSKWFAGNTVIAELPGRTVVQANNRNGTSVPLVNFLQPRTIGVCGKGRYGLAEMAVLRAQDLSQ
jgi:hypothetical protein